MVMQEPEQKKRQEQLKAGFTAASLEIEGVRQDSATSRNFVGPNEALLAPLLRGIANDFAAANDKNKKRPIDIPDK